MAVLPNGAYDDSDRWGRLRPQSRSGDLDDCVRPRQYFSVTKFLSFIAASSSNLSLSDRLGSLTFDRLIFAYGISLRMCEMQLSRARRLSSERTMYQGACSLSVASSIMSRAREKAYHRPYDSRSIGLNFHCRNGSLMRAENRLSCSSCPTSSQILINLMPPSTTYFSSCGQSSRKRRCSCSLQNPMTYSTPARLYQLRSKMTISPAAGNRST